jgi:predicted nucleotidyltransferase
MSEHGNRIPVQVEQSVNAFVEAAKAAFESDLVSVVLFGSAAEGNLRATSDVNILLVLKRFEQSRADRLREPMRVAHAAVLLNAMFVLESEVSAANEAFAVKFADIRTRHRVLFGPDPFASLGTPRDALIRRLKQVLLNLQLRLRERYVMLSLREEQLALVIADAAPPLRASAASLLQLEGRPAAAPKAALEQLVNEWNDARLSEALVQISSARNDKPLEPGIAAATLMSLIELTQRLRERIDRLH